MLSIAALVLVAALALAGCSTAGSADQPETAGAEATSSAQAAPTEMPTLAESTAAEQGGESAPASVDPEQVKASASAAGRPEAAFDENCEVWEMSDVNTEEQKWANKLGSEWLDSTPAVLCPDALAFPFYFVESWESPATGVLQVNVDSTIDAIEVNPDATKLAWIASDTMCALYDDEPELSKVTAVTENDSRQETFTRGDYESDPTRCH